MGSSAPAPPVGNVRVVGEAMPQVGVVIPTHNHVADTLECLASLVATGYPNLVVVVVDNGSTDGSPQRVLERYPCVHIIPLDRNLGFARAVNAGVAFVLDQGCRYVMLMNNDAVVRADAVHSLVAFALEHGGDCILSPKVMHYGCDSVWSMGSRVRRATFDLLDFGPGRTGRLPLDRSVAVDVVLGCGMFATDGVFSRIGFLDEAFFFYYEDIDFSLRAGDAGIDLLTVPWALVWHKVSESTRDTTYLREYYRAKASVAFYLKHTSGWHRLLVSGYRLLSALSFTCRNLIQGSLKPIAGHWCGLAAGLARGPALPRG